MKILFIGNSYTYYNDMPAIFRKLADENGKHVEVYSVTAGGRYLRQNMDADDTCAMQLKALLQDHYFDVCVIQEQSTYPVRDLDGFLKDAARLAEMLSPSVKRFVLYTTWGRQFGAKFLTESGLTPESMADRLAHAYRQAASQIQTNLCKEAALSPVGAAFAAINHLGSLELYTPDLSHPSYTGSCLAAYVHYFTIFGVLPEQTDSLQLPEATVSVFRKTVSDL